LDDVADAELKVGDFWIRYDGWVAEMWGTDSLSVSIL